MFSQLLSKWHFILGICKSSFEEIFFHYFFSAWLGSVASPLLLFAVQTKVTCFTTWRGIGLVKKELVNNKLNSDFSKTTST